MPVFIYPERRGLLGAINGNAFDNLLAFLISTDAYLNFFKSTAIFPSHDWCGGTLSRIRINVEFGRNRAISFRLGVELELTIACAKAKGQSHPDTSHRFTYFCLLNLA